MNVQIILLFLGSCISGLDAGQTKYLKPVVTMKNENTYDFACKSEQTDKQLCCSLYIKSGVRGRDQRILRWSASRNIEDCDYKNDYVLPAEKDMVTSYTTDDKVCRATITRSEDDSDEIGNNIGIDNFVLFENRYYVQIDIFRMVHYYCTNEARCDNKFTRKEIDSLRGVYCE